MERSIVEFWQHLISSDFSSSISTKSKTIFWFITLCRSLSRFDRRRKYKSNHFTPVGRQLDSHVKAYSINGDAT